MIERAKSRCAHYLDRVSFKVIDATDYEQLISLGAASFDSAVANMALMDIAHINPLLSALHKLLKPRGTVVFSVMHPCFQSPQMVKVYEEQETGHDPLARAIVVDQLLTNKQIMVYYRCYYVVTEASHQEPSLYYKYWYEFAGLLNHENSYHRDIGLTLIANLVKVDDENRLSLIWTEYLAHIGDKKFMTGEYCLRNLRTILTERGLICKMTWLATC